jgi:hypothetical protein
LQYWKIVAGHREKDPDETKSVILGDWLRHNYVAIGWKKNTSQGKTFIRDMQIGDQVVVVTNGYVWALGTIEDEAKNVDSTKNSHLYPNQRQVTWSKITKMEYRNFPKFLYNKLKHPKALKLLKSLKRSSKVSRRGLKRSGRMDASWRLSILCML